MAVVRSHFEKDVLRAIPLVKQFFHEVLPTTQSETNRTLVPFVAGVADYLDLHLGIPLILDTSVSFAGASFAAASTCATFSASTASGANARADRRLSIASNRSTKRIIRFRRPLTGGQAE
jgi:hypothetical protein